MTRAAADGTPRHGPFHLRAASGTPCPAVVGLPRRWQSGNYARHVMTIGKAGAVRQWVYTPTLLNGVPVPVIMTVTVNFKLS